MKETTEEDYRLAISVEERKCCLTYSELSTTKENRQDYPNKELLTNKFTADDTGDANKEIILSTPKQTQLFPSESSKIVKTEINRYRQFFIFISNNKKIAWQSWEGINKHSTAVHHKKFERNQEKCYSLDRSHSKSWFSMWGSFGCKVCQWHGKRNAGYQRMVQ